MAMNQIVKLKLESRLADLRKEGKSTRAIATTLSKESNHVVTQSSVSRYLQNNKKIVQQAVKSNDRLKARAAEIELNTIEERHTVIAKIKALADQAEAAGDLKTSLYALRTAIAALDSLDERLGDISRAPTVNVELHQEYLELKAVVLGVLCPNCRRKLKERLSHEAE